MNLAYFTNQYPKVSHSFIRREIQALEKRGHTVSRFALRADESELVDISDKEEFAKTGYILSEAKFSIIRAVLAVIFRTPVSFLSALKLAMKLGFHSDRGIARHIIYLLESCVLLGWQERENIEHIHAHFGTNSTTVVMLAYVLGGAEYSFTVHGPEEFDKPEFISIREKIVCSQFVIAISSYGRSQLLRWIPLEHWDKVKVIRCGLDDAFLAEQSVDIPLSSNQLVCVGRLCEQKGQLLLLDAMKGLIDKGMSCTLVLAGDGPMRTEVETRIQQYNLTDYVEITGWISSEQVKTLLLESRGLVLPSFAEGLPVVIMEALALRRPVISTYVAGIPALVKHQENGWLIPAGSTEVITIAMKELLELGEASLTEMGVRGHVAVLEKHNIEVEVEKLAKLFEQSVEK